MTETSLTLYRRSELQEVSNGCLHRYKTIWLDGTADESDMSLVGIGFHRIKYRYIVKLLEYQISQDSELAKEAFIEGVAAAQTPARLLPELRNLWEWHAERYELQLDQYVTHEEKQISGDVVFTPDLVTANPRYNELEIHDDKSGWAPPMSEDELRQLYQARVYACFARDRWPNFASYRFTLWAVRFNKRVSVAFTEQELDDIALEVRADIATLEHAKAENSWPATAGPSCHFCTLQCPLLDQPAVMPQRLLEPSAAAKLGAWALAAEGMLKIAKKTLKGYCSAHGPLDVNGVVWDNRLSEQRTYRLDAVLEAIKMLNIAGAFEDPKQEGLTISHSALKKLFSVHPELESALQGQANVKPTYRFSAKKAGEAEVEEQQ